MCISLQFTLHALFIVSSNLYTITFSNPGIFEELFYDYSSVVRPLSTGPTDARVRMVTALREQAPNMTLQNPAFCGVSGRIGGRMARSTTNETAAMRHHQRYHRVSLLDTVKQTQTLTRDTPTSDDVDDHVGADLTLF
jgi:hypothetical protein